MQIGKILKASCVTIKENLTTLLTLSLSWGIIVSVVYILFDILIGMGAAAATIVIIPLLVSIQMISAKAVNRKEEVNTKDFYVGLKNFSASFILEGKTWFKGFLLALLGFLIGAIVCGIAVYFQSIKALPNLINDFSNTSDFSVIYDQMMSLSWMNKALDIAAYISFVFGTLLFAWKGMNNCLLPYICFETKFALMNAVEISQKYTKANSKSFFIIHFIYVLVLIPVIALGVILNKLLVLAGVGELLSLSIAMVISCVLIGFLLYFYEITTYHIYRHYFKDAIMETYQNHIKKVEEMIKNIQEGKLNGEPSNPTNDDNPLKDVNPDIAPLDIDDKDDKDDTTKS